jgi:DNA-binding transcriptional regulator YiaG
MRKKKSAILEAVHETATGLHDAGVMDRVTLREFDRLCLPPIAKASSDRPIAIPNNKKFVTDLNSTVNPILNTIE